VKRKEATEEDPRKTARRENKELRRSSAERELLAINYT